MELFQAPVWLLVAVFMVTCEHVHSRTVQGVRTQIKKPEGTNGHIKSPNFPVGAASSRGIMRSMTGPEPSLPGLPPTVEHLYQLQCTSTPCFIQLIFDDWDLPPEGFIQVKDVGFTSTFLASDHRPIFSSEGRFVNITYTEPQGVKGNFAGFKATFRMVSYDKDVWTTKKHKPAPQSECTRLKSVLGGTVEQTGKTSQIKMHGRLFYDCVWVLKPVESSVLVHYSLMFTQFTLGTFSPKPHVEVHSSTTSEGPVKGMLYSGQDLQHSKLRKYNSSTGFYVRLLGELRPDFDIIKFTYTPYTVLSGTNTETETTVGNSAIKRSTLEAKKSAVIIPTPTQIIPIFGNITSFQFYAETLSPVTLQVWRSTPKRNEIFLVAQLTHEPASKKFNQVDLPLNKQIPVETGDVLGFRFDQGCPIPFESYACEGSDDMLTRMIAQPYQILPGSTFHFTSTNVCQKFSLSAKISWSSDADCYLPIGSSYHRGFRCMKAERCIPWQLQCDNDDHCSTNEDETSLLCQASKRRSWSVQKGKCVNATVLSKTSNATLDTCATRCRSETLCTGFTFDTRSSGLGLCALLGSTCKPQQTSLRASQQILTFQFQIEGYSVKVGNCYGHWHDITSLKVPLSDCLAECDHQMACRAVSYVFADRDCRIKQHLCSEPQVRDAATLEYLFIKMGPVAAIPSSHLKPGHCPSNKRWCVAGFCAFSWQSCEVPLSTTTVPPLATRVVPKPTSVATIPNSGVCGHKQSPCGPGATKKCFHYNEACNWVNDCGNKADEKNCKWDGPFFWILVPILLLVFLMASIYHCMRRRTICNLMTRHQGAGGRANQDSYVENISSYINPAFNQDALAVAMAPPSYEQVVNTDMYPPLHKSVQDEAPPPSYDSVAVGMELQATGQQSETETSRNQDASASDVGCGTPSSTHALWRPPNESFDNHLI